jgi:DNA-binding NtrC family response regulator
VVLAEGEEIELNVLPQEIDPKSDQSKKLDAADSITVDGATDLKEAKREFERKFIEKCLKRSGGNITQAAAMLGMHRQSLQHKIKELGLIKKFVG